MTLDCIDRASQVTRREAIQRAVGIAGLAAFSQLDAVEELNAAPAASPGSSGGDPMEKLRIATC